ncbi:hypothetical protein BDV3_001854 [Batrachochytrium dendrobatidis]
MVLVCIYVSKAVPVAIDTDFSHHYLVDFESVNTNRQPTYIRFNTIHDIPERAQDTYFPRLKKRDLNSNATNRVQTIQTKLFTISLDCTPPFGELLDPVTAISSTCQNVAYTLTRVMTRLEQSLYLRTPITVTFSYKSLCTATGSASLGKACPVSDDTLGYASPAAWHVFNRDAADANHLDAGYMYPSSLAKQYVPDDVAFRNTDGVDIIAVLNSDVNWWFPSPDDQLGAGDNGKWGLYSTTHGGSINSSTYSYDFEQTTLHELCHGLGIVSSWNMIGDNSTFLPSFLDINANGRITGLAQPYIFNRWLSDTINHVWLRNYADQIQSSINQAIQQSTQNNWYSIFNTTIAAGIARALGGKNGLFQTPGAVAAWYPDTDYTTKESGLYKYAIIYTPRVYEAGSTLSHVDANTYIGTENVLMRPVGTGGIGLDSILPMGSKGPIGEAALGIFRSMGYVTI